MKKLEGNLNYELKTDFNSAGKKSVLAMTSTIHLLIRFIKEDLKLPTASITLALKQSEQIPSLLPMTLWQYGLITLIQLDQLLDWLCDAQLD